MNQRFGELRSMLNASPSVARYDDLMELLTLMNREDRNYVKRVIPYVEGILSRRYNDGLRVMDAKDFKSGGESEMRRAFARTYMGAAIPTSALKDRERALTLLRLTYAPELRNLDLSGAALKPDETIQVLQRFGPQVTTASARGMNLPGNTLRRLQKTLPQMTLDLRGNPAIDYEEARQLSGKAFLTKILVDAPYEVKPDREQLFDGLEAQLGMVLDATPTFRKKRKLHISGGVGEWSGIEIPDAYYLAILDYRDGKIHAQLRVEGNGETRTGEAVLGVPSFDQRTEKLDQRSVNKLLGELEDALRRLMEQLPTDAPW